ncbi:MAG: hypothetical protein KBT27_01095 [Prevotellaceae bacterium]|nr:hypothetical protein [Candidatus Faecinaster equi]
MTKMTFDDIQKQKQIIKAQIQQEKENLQICVDDLFSPFNALSFLWSKKEKNKKSSLIPSLSLTNVIKYAKIARNIYTVYHTIKAIKHFFKK